MRYALVNSAGEILQHRDFAEPPPPFGNATKAASLKWLPDVPPAVEPWQVATRVEPVDFDGEAVEYTVADRPLEEIKAEKLAALADFRWQKETGGFLFNGVTIATDDRSQLKITGARVAAEAAEPGWTVHWKVAPGQFVTLTKADIIAISDAVRAHVQACFDSEAAHAAAINALETAEAVYEYDFTGGW